MNKVNKVEKLKQYESAHDTTCLYPVIVHDRITCFDERTLDSYHYIVTPTCT